MFLSVCGITFISCWILSALAQESKAEIKDEPKIVAKQLKSEVQPLSLEQEKKVEPAASVNKTPEVKSEKESEEEQLRLKLKAMPLEERMKQTITLDLRNIDVNEALKYISSKGAINIVPTKNVSGRVTMTLENVPLKDVLDLMLRSNGLAYIMQGDIFNIMTEAEYKALYGKNFYDLRQVKVLRLKYAIPEQAFNMLDALKSEIGRVLVDQEAGNVMIMETPERIVMMQQALEQFEKENTVEVFNLKYAKAKDVEEMLKARLDSKKVGSVKSDERNNQLIVQTLPDRMQEVRRLVASMDRSTKEVLIDTKIIKIRLDDLESRGIEWEGILSVAKQGGQSYAGTYPFSVITNSTTAPFQTRTNYFTNSVAEGGTGSNIGGYPFSGTTNNASIAQYTALGENLHMGVFGSKRDLDVVANYLSTLGNSRVISNPKIVVVNNQEAKIHIGERQAYVTSTTTAGQTTNTVSEEVTFVDVGIQLSVTATINDDGYITMKIKPEISSVSTYLVTAQQNKIPIVDTTLTETTVMMKDGTTLLIGGLRKEEKTDNAKQVPFLGNLPILGNLFKNSTNQTVRTELLVMITPHIIKGNEFNVGDALASAEETTKGYQDYQPLTINNKLPPEGQAAKVGIEMKPYRDYLSFSEKIDGAPQLKGQKYDTN